MNEFYRAPFQLATLQMTCRPGTYTEYTHGMYRLPYISYICHAHVMLQQVAPRVCTYRISCVYDTPYIPYIYRTYVWCDRWPRGACHLMALPSDQPLRSHAKLHTFSSSAVGFHHAGANTLCYPRKEVSRSAWQGTPGATLHPTCVTAVHYCTYLGPKR